MNIVAIALVVLAAQAPIYPGVTTSIDPGEVIDAGLTNTLVEFKIVATNLPVVTAASYSVDFDPSVLMYVGVDTVAFEFSVPQGGDPAAGHLSFLLAGQEISGTQILCIVKFWVIGWGSCPIRLGCADTEAEAGNTTPFIVVVSEDGAQADGFGVGVVGQGLFSNVPLASPSGLEQADRIGGDAAEAGFVDPDGRVAFRAGLPGLAMAADVQVEVKPEGIPFDGSGVIGASVLPLATSVEIGTGILPTGSYHWRLRLHVTGVNASPWIEFGTTGSDFAVEVAAEPKPASTGSNSIGSLSCSAGAGGGTLLTVLLLFLGATRVR